MVTASAAAVERACRWKRRRAARAADVRRRRRNRHCPKTVAGLDIERVVAGAEVDVAGDHDGAAGPAAGGDLADGRAGWRCAKIDRGRVVAESRRRCRLRSSRCSGSARASPNGRRSQRRSPLSPTRVATRSCRCSMIEFTVAPLSIRIAFAAAEVGAAALGADRPADRRSAGTVAPPPMWSAGRARAGRLGADRSRSWSCRRRCSRLGRARRSTRRWH